MEAKLAEYRARKRKEETKERIYNMITLNSPKGRESISNDVPKLEDGYTSDSSLISHTSEGAESFQSNTSDDHIGCPTFTWFTVITYTLYLLLWATLYAIAIHLEFGTVFLIISILYGIYMNTRTGPKKDGEVSAYSVFNPNCEAIDGTLKAEQFEREIRYGAGSVR